MQYNCTKIRSICRLSSCQHNCHQVFLSILLSFVHHLAGHLQEAIIIIMKLFVHSFIICALTLHCADLGVNDNFDGAASCGSRRSINLQETHNYFRFVTKSAYSPSVLCCSSTGCGSVNVQGDNRAYDCILQPFISLTGLESRLFSLVGSTLVVQKYTIHLHHQLLDKSHKSFPRQIVLLLYRPQQTQNTIICHGKLVDNSGIMPVFTIENVVG